MASDARELELRNSLALTEDEIASLVDRCPEEQKKIFEGWLRGTHQLDGDLIERGDEQCDEDDAHRRGR